MTFTLPSNILVIPIAVPLFTAALLLLVSRWGTYRRSDLQQVAAAIALSINLLVALALLAYTLQGNRLVMQMGLWPAPFGITVVCDALSATMLTVTSILALAILPFAAGTMDPHRRRMGYFPLSLFLMMGVNGAFLAGDIFNLYVFFEVLLMASFVLLTLGGTPGQINGGIRYVVLNLLASIMLLTAAGVAYGAVGTLNMAHLAVRLDEAPTFIKYVLAGLMLVAFGSKAALFPLFFWLPSSYHTPHPAVTALFGGILTKVGIYTLIRAFTLLLPTVLADWQPLLLTVAGLTMFIGVLGAFAQPTIRRLLSFHIISQVGYMVMGLAIVASPTSLGAGFALAATLIFVIHNMLVKTALMMGGGTAELDLGSGNLTTIGGLAKRRPLLAFIFFIAAFSLAGVPPSSGFVGKLSLLQATLDTQHYFVAGVSVLVSLLTTMSMIRLWQYSFWGAYKPGRALSSPLRKPHSTALVMTPMAILVAISLAMGIFFEPVFQAATKVAEQTLDRAGYIAAVNPELRMPALPGESAMNLPQEEHP